MARMRCPKCGRAYEIPPELAIRLPGSFAECVCGEWLAGNRALILARLMEPGQSSEIDVTPYLIDSMSIETPRLPDPEEDETEATPLSVRIHGRTSAGTFTNIFTISNAPLWIGQKGCHVDLDDAELSIRHCAIISRQGALVIRDADSHTGTYLDGEPISDAVLEPGVHLLRAGHALLCIEPVDEPGQKVEPLDLDDSEVLEPSPHALQLLRERRERAHTPAKPQRLAVICVEGILAGRELEIPEDGLVIGREGDLRVPDDFLSRRHFEIVHDPEGGLRVHDLGSRNGTFLNTFPAKNARAHAGDEVRAGLNLFRIVEKE